MSLCLVLDITLLLLLLLLLSVLFPTNVKNGESSCNDKGEMIWTGYISFLANNCGNDRFDYFDISAGLTSEFMLSLIEERRTD